MSDHIFDLYIAQIAKKPLLSAKTEQKLSYDILFNKSELMQKILERDAGVSEMVRILGEVLNGQRRLSYTIEVDTDDGGVDSKRDKSLVIEAIKTFMTVAGRKYKSSKTRVSKLKKALSRIDIGFPILSEVSASTGIGKGLIHTIEHSKKGLIEGNLRLVVSIAKKFRGSGVPMCDLIQEGNIGLMRAAEDFDYHRHNRFSTYAYYWIRQHISRHIMNCGKTIRIPVHTGNLLFLMSRKDRSLTNSLGRDPTDKDMADALGISIEKYQELLVIDRGPLSLDSEDCGDGDTYNGTKLLDIIPLSDEIEQEKVVEQSEIRDAIERALVQLTPREQKILRLHYGIYPDGYPHSFAEIVREESYCRQYAQMVHKEGLQKMSKIIKRTK